MRTGPFVGALVATAFVLVGCGAAASDPVDGDTTAAADASTTCIGCDSTGGDTSEPVQSLPCDVAEILTTHCGSCHTAVPQFGAPMALVDYGDLQVPAVSDPTRTVAAMVAARIVDEDSPMPPTGDLPEADRQVVLDWIAAGTPAGTDTCDPPDDTSDTSDTEEPPYELPCETPTAVFTAHGGSEGTDFQVPLTDDLYQCFTFESPFDGSEQGVAWAPIIDDARVIHHWLLLRAPEGTVPGESGPCGGSFGSNGDLIMGWAPGAPSFTLPDDVGLELPGPGEVLVLQIHYNNIPGYTDAMDRSGVALCTEPPRAAAAASIWLGTVNIDIPPNTTGYSTAGECDTSFVDEPFNILSSWPHMHEHGESLTTEIVRSGDDTPEMLVSVEGWNFDNQIYYPHTPAVQVQPGDVLRTTCTYDNETEERVTVGEGTGDEMCFNFALVYPISAFGDDGIRRKCGLL